MNAAVGPTPFVPRRSSFPTSCQPTAPTGRLSSVEGDVKMKVYKAEAERLVKGCLRRLSTDNAKKLGESFTKVVRTNPTIVFAIVLNQVQSYDDLFPPVFETGRYLTNFGFKVLAYSLLDALTASETKTKDE
ncbi:Tho2 protein [Pseudohyphozyma bogoriensis]|nr:Tho2 protein [Pseudohyphozyma bogoriensis]